MGTVVSLNGTTFPRDQAKVSVFDRGFLYGDSVYEVMRTYQGVPFEEQRHLLRLASSAERIGMGLPVPLSTLSQELRAAHLASGNAESYLRVVVTRGAGEIGLDPGLAEEPTRLVIAQPVKSPPASAYEEGAAIALVHVRHNFRHGVDPMAKTGNYLNSVLAVAEAKRRGAYEAVMLDHRDYITEGASSNVFCVIGGSVLTPPLDVGILEGVTRTVVMEQAKAAGMRALELPLTEAALKQADEVFITSSVREIVPIVKVDDTTIGAGVPGPIYKRVRSLYDAYVHSYVSAALG